VNDGRASIAARSGRHFSAADVARARREGWRSMLIDPFVGGDLVARVQRIWKRE
jgi:hypothetical protein